MDTYWLAPGTDAQVHPAKAQNRHNNAANPPVRNRDCHALPRVYGQKEHNQHQISTKSAPNPTARMSTKKNKASQLQLLYKQRELRTNHAVGRRRTTEPSRTRKGGEKWVDLQGASPEINTQQADLQRASPEICAAKDDHQPWRDQNLAQPRGATPDEWTFNSLTA